MKNPSFFAILGYFWLVFVIFIVSHETWGKIFGKNRVSRETLNAKKYRKTQEIKEIKSRV